MKLKNRKVLPPIRCEVCGMEIKRPVSSQKVCISKNINKQTKCQRKRQKQQMTEHYHRNKLEAKKTDSKKPCLKCNRKFKRAGIHDRICEDCERSNLHVQYWAYKIPVIAN